MDNITLFMISYLLFRTIIIIYEDYFINNDIKKI
jgi:hypothetical protein